MKPYQPIQNYPIFILLTTAFLIGCFTVGQYGQSWDEPDIYRYSEYTINAYRFIFNPQNLPAYDSNLNFYGPAYYLMVNLFTRVLMFIVPSWTTVIAWHFTYFITFLAGVYILYLLSKRWLSELAAFGVALLFLCQPLLWGHSFINPKDTPFMTFFMASIYLGWQMADAQPRSSRRAGLMIIAGLMLGFTISLRVLGPLAGLFVLIYAAIKYKQKAISLAIVYLLIAGITSYLTWPYLWKSPFVNYFKSLILMSQFPWDSKVLFWGDTYIANELPRSFFPTMFSLQLTEPLLALCIIGIFVMALSRKLEPILLFSAWFLIPAMLIIFSKSVLYDNARQLYFLLPPLFFVSGFAIEWLFKYIHQQKFRYIFLMLIIAPGLLTGIRLYPYEYSYYNNFIGGINGAVGQFETDYWGVSFKEAMDYINVIAPNHARILVMSGSDEIARQYARADLQVVTEKNDPAPQEKYTYALILTRKNQGERRCTRSDIIYKVGKDNAVFAIIKKLGNKGRC